MVAGAALVAGSVGALGFAVAADPGPDVTPAGADTAADRAPGPAGADVRPVVDPAAHRLLERAGRAPGTTTYSGTQYVTAWAGTVDRGAVARAVEVSHDPARGTTLRDLRAGSTRGASVHTAAAPTPSLLGVGAVGLIARHYSLDTAGTAHVAGRLSDVVEARRPGTTGLAARFWLDRASGLVLRREVYDGRGRLSRASAFVEVTVSPARATAAAVGSTAWPQSLDSAQLARMRARGWTCPDQLPGPLPLVDARRGGAGGAVLHLSYADGISSLSVFQQWGRLDDGQIAGYREATVGGRTVWVRTEVPMRVVWSADGLVYTIVADAPRRTVEAAVTRLSVAGSGADGGPLGRLERGLGRVASWFNPMD